MSETDTAPVAGPSRLDPLDPPSRLEAGRWQMDVGPAAVSLELDQSLGVAYIDPGILVLEGPESTPTSFEGLGIFRPTVFLTTSAFDVVLGRQKATADLEPWLSALEGIENLETGTDLVGNVETHWWQFDEPDDCSPCSRRLFGAGELTGAFFTPDGYRWKLWTFEVDGQPLMITLGARIERFDAFEASMQPVLASLMVDKAQRLWSPFEPSDATRGQWAIGRSELVLADPSRPTEKVERDGDLILAGRDERVLLASVGYPVDPGAGGWDVPPAEGTFPLIVVGHALGGDGLLGPLDEALVTAGYVVARVRFPESSPPVSDFYAIGEQPLDMSFVISELLDDALPESVRGAIDDERIGVVGFSMGGTTVYGLLGASCCADPRIDAAIAHAPTSFDFDDGLNFGDTPLLLIGSRSDSIAPLASLEETQASANNSIALFSHPSSAHLDWVTPANGEAFEATIELSRAFFAQHLKGAAITIADVAVRLDGAFVASSG